MKKITFKEASFKGLRRQAGLTLIELLVALTVGLVVTIIALSMMVLGRSGYTSVDATTQLIDKERFAVDMMTRVIAQAGFEDFAASTVVTRAHAGMLGADPEPDVFGWNNAVYAGAPTFPGISTTTSPSQIADGNRTASSCGASDTSCMNGSDILLVRFQGVTSHSTPTIGDMSMINCRGNGERSLQNNSLDTRAVSVFYVHRDSATGEPSLTCAIYNHATSTWSSEPLLEGVEAMQVLFGTDNVVPAQVPVDPVGDTITDRWLRADQLKVASNPGVTRENFRRVRAVRVGLVLRGPVGSAQERITATMTPLGSPTFVSTNDAGSQLNVAADGRLRRVITFTVHLRNELGLR